MRRTIGCTVLVLSAVTLAHAELTLETHPLAVTSHGSAAIVLEASSSHAAVRVFGPSGDSTPQTTSTVLVLQPGDWADQAASYSSKSLTEEVLRAVGGPARLGVSIIRNDWDVDLEAFPSLPTPSARWLLYADPREAQNLARRLTRLWEEIRGPPQLSYADYRTRSLEMFDYALRASRVLQISSDGQHRAVPNAAHFPTPLGWLYRAMLDEAGHSTLAGCRFRPDYHAGGSEGGPWSLYSRLVGVLEEHRPQGDVQSVRDKTGEVTGRIWWLPESLGLLSQAFLIAKSAVTDAAIYAEFAVMGDIDPAAVEVAACSAHRLLAGHDIVTRSIRERSAIYAETDRVLSEAWVRVKALDAPPRFFAAASHVSRLFGVGSADLLRAYGDGATDPGQPDGSTALAYWWAVDPNCLGLAPGQSYLPTRAGREALRTINEKLFDFVNRSEMRWLVANPGSLRSPDGKARFEKPEGVSPALAFDLRMVMREQAAVEKLLKQMQLEKDGILRLGKEDIRQLSRSHRALYCLQFAEIARQMNTEPEALFQTLKKVTKILQDLKADGVILDAHTGFDNYWYRVATGMAYMIALHAGGRDDLLRQYRDMVADLLRKLIAEEQARAGSVSSLPPGIRQELSALVDAVRKPARELSADLQKALDLYFSSDLAERPLMSCSEHQIARARTLTTEPLGGSVVDPPQRVEALRSGGLRPLAIAFELMPGGALDDQASPDAGPDGAALCSALEERRLSFAKAVAGETPALPLTFSDLLNGKRVLVFEGALPLRQEIGALAPFAMLAMSPPYDMPPPTEMSSHLHKAKARSAAYTAKLALLARVAGLPRAQWTRISPNLDMPSLRDLLRRALHDLPDNAPEGRMKRIGSVEAELQDFVDAILPAFEFVEPVAAERFERPGGFGEMRYAARPILRVDTAAARVGVEAAQLLPTAGLSADMLDMRIVPTGHTFPEGTPFAGSPQFEAALFVRRGMDASGVASAGRTAGAHAIADGAVEMVPLGVTVSPLHIDDSGKLMGEALIGISYTRTEPAVLRAALRTLGLPNFLTPENVQIRPEFESDRSLRGLFLTFALSIGEIPLGEISLRLIDVDADIDIADALSGAVEKLFDDRLALALARSGKFTRLARRPQSDAAWEDAPIRFGIALEEGVVPVTHHLDWVGGTLTLRSRFELGVGLSGADRDTATAEAEIIVGPDGFAIRRLAFADDVREVLSKFVGRLTHRLDLEHTLEDGLSLVPVFDGKMLRLELRAGFTVAGCGVEMRESLPLDRAEIEQRLNDLSATVGRDLAACAATAAIDRIEDWLRGRSVTLFGMTVRPIFDRTMESEIETEAGLAIAVEFEPDAIESCGTRRSIVISGLRLSREKGLDLSPMSPRDQAVLGTVVLCRIEALLDLRDTALISNPVVGRNAIAVDVTLQDLPFLGTVPLGRIVVTDLGDDAGDTVRATVARTAQAALSDVLTERLGGREVPLPGIGDFQLDSADAVSIAIWGDEREVTLHGRLRISDYHVPVTIALSLEGGGIDVRPDRDALAELMTGRLLGAINAALPSLPGASVKVDPFFFGPLDDRRLRWGFVFRVDAQFDLGGQGIVVVLDRVTISEEGMRLPTEIRIGLATPLIFPPGISLARVLVIYRTDGNSAGAGLELGADLTFLDPTLARLVKFVVLMELTDVDQLGFSMEGDLVVLDTLPVFEAAADLQLGGGRFSYSATTKKALRDVLGLKLKGWADLPKTVLVARSSLEVLGVNLSDNELTLCAERNGCDANVPYGVRLESDHDLLITKTAVVAKADLDLRNASLGGAIHLSLFGWSPVAADLSVDRKRAEVKLDFLGIDVRIVTPSVETMTPSHILAILESLLDISLKDLLEVDLSKFTFSVASGDGSVYTSDGGESDGQPESSGGQPESSDGQPDSPGDSGESPDLHNPNAPRDLAPLPAADWGVPVEGYACQKFSGAAKRSFNPKDGGERVYIEGRQTGVATQWHYRTWEDPWRPLPLKSDDDFWLAGFADRHHWLVTGAAANQYCELPPGGPIQMREGIWRIGAARRPVSLYGVCPHGRDEWMPAPRIRSYVVPHDQEADFSGAGLPVYCLPGGEVIGSHLFGEGKSIHVLFRCPHDKRLSEASRNHKYYKQLCGPDKGYLVISEDEAGISAVKNLDAMDELDLFNRVVRPRALNMPTLRKSEQRRFSLSVSTPDDTDVREAQEVDSGTLIFAIRYHERDDSTILMEARVPRDDPLFAVYNDRSGNNALAKALLKRWIRDDQPPRKALLGLQTEPHRVILEAGSNQIEVLDRRGETVHTITLTLPMQRPSVDGMVVATAMDMPEIFEALAPEIEHLPNSSIWRVVLGHNVDRAYHLVALLRQREWDEAPLRILFDAYDPRAPASPDGYRPAEQITGDHRYDQLNVGRASRRHCWTLKERADEIRDRYDPVPPRSELIRDIEDTIVAPDRYSPGESYVETEHWDLVPASSSQTLCPS